MRASRLPLAAALIGVVLAGCAGLPPGASDGGIEPTPVADREQLAAQSLVFYQELLHRLVTATPATQAEIFANVKRDFETQPSSSSRLRYALALAAPGHQSTDLSAAQKLLQQVVSEPETLTALENAVAFIELQKLDRQLALTQENQRLQATGTRVDRDRLAALQRRLQAETEENLRLRRALDEANSKLEAIATIERQSSQQRAPGAPAPAPQGRNP